MSQKLYIIEIVIKAKGILYMWYIYFYIISGQILGSLAILGSGLID